MEKCLLKKIIYLFVCLFVLDRGKGKETERNRNINVWLPLMCPLWGPDLACNPGMCPDWELSQHHFGLQAGTQSTEPHQLGQKKYLLYN